MSPALVNPTFNLRSNKFQGEPVLCTNFDPDPKGRFQYYRGEEGALFGKDAPESMVEEDYFWTIHFSAPLPEERPDQVPVEEIRRLGQDDITLLGVSDALSGHPVIAETLLQYSTHYDAPTSRLKDACLCSLQSVGGR